MPKKVSFGSQPVDKAAKQEQWVANRVIPEDPEVILEKVKTKRFTIDVPEPAHRAFKQICAGEGITMAEKINLFISECISRNQSQP